MPPPWGKCGETELKYLSVYTVPTCVTECETDYVYKQCGCVDVSMPNADGRFVPYPIITSGQSKLAERSHRRRTWTVRSYSRGGANVHPHLVHPTRHPHRAYLVALSILTTGHVLAVQGRPLFALNIALHVFGSRLHQIRDSLGHPHSKRHLDRFSRFCTAHGRQPLYCTTGRHFSSSKLPLFMEIWTPYNTWILAHTRVSTRNGITIG